MPRKIALREATTQAIAYTLPKEGTKATRHPQRAHQHVRKTPRGLFSYTRAIRQSFSNGFSPILTGGQAPRAPVSKTTCLPDSHQSPEQTMRNGRSHFRTRSLPSGLKTASSFLPIRGPHLCAVAHRDTTFRPDAERLARCGRQHDPVPTPSERVATDL